MTARRMDARWNLRRARLIRLDGLRRAAREHLDEAAWLIRAELLRAAQQRRLRH